MFKAPGCEDASLVDRLWRSTPRCGALRIEGDARREPASGRLWSPLALPSIGQPHPLRMLSMGRTTRKQGRPLVTHQLTWRQKLDAKRHLVTLLWGGSELGPAFRGPQCLSLRVRSPHAFAFVAMFGGILLEFFGPEPAHTRAHGDRLSAQSNAADLNGSVGWLRSNSMRRRSR
jgi:hypothetical protein